MHFFDERFCSFVRETEKEKEKEKEREKLDGARSPLSISAQRRVDSVFVFGTRMPSETLFVKLDDDLWAFDVGLTRWHQISFVAVLPLHEKHELATRVRGADDSLWLKSAIEASWPRIVIVIHGLLLFGRGSFGFLLAFLWFFLLASFGLESGDDVGTIEIILWLPSVFAVGISFPLDKIFDFAFRGPFVQDFLDRVLFLLLFAIGSSTSSHVCC